VFLPPTLLSHSFLVSSLAISTTLSSFLTLSSSQIVKLLDYSFDDVRREHILTLPLLAVTLEDVLLDHAVLEHPVDLCLFSATGLFSALAHLHRNAVAHRDIKPANIMFGFDGVPVLIDFGTAWDGASRGDGDEEGAMSCSVGTGSVGTCHGELTVSDRIERLNFSSRHRHTTASPSTCGRQASRWRNFSAPVENAKTAWGSSKVRVGAAPRPRTRIQGHPSPRLPVGIRVSLLALRAHPTRLVTRRRRLRHKHRLRRGRTRRRSRRPMPGLKSGRPAHKLNH
jgi:hypothetical protein